MSLFITIIVINSCTKKYVKLLPTGNSSSRKMAEAVANVARRVNATVEEGKDCLGKRESFVFFFLCVLLIFIQFPNR